MDKYIELEKQAQRFLDETDTMQFSTVELLTMFYNQQEQLTLTDVSQRSELLPDFLYEDDGIIKVGVHGDSSVTDEWNDYLKKLGNCG